MEHCQEMQDSSTLHRSQLERATWCSRGMPWRKTQRRGRTQKPRVELGGRAIGGLAVLYRGSRGAAHSRKKIRDAEMGGWSDGRRDREGHSLRSDRVKWAGTVTHWRAHNNAVGEKQGASETADHSQLKGKDNRPQARGLWAWGGCPGQATMDTDPFSLKFTCDFFYDIASTSGLRQVQLH